MLGFQSFYASSDCVDMDIGDREAWINFIGALPCVAMVDDGFLLGLQPDCKLQVPSASLMKDLAC